MERKVVGVVEGDRKQTYYHLHRLRFMSEFKTFVGMNLQQTVGWTFMMNAWQKS